jgi:cytoskeletal protein RodZ
MTDHRPRVEMERAETEKVAKLQEIGSNLRQIRQDSALSIEDISERTRIQPRLLRALEEGRFDVLPEPVYIQSMVKKYGESLGVDCLELAKSVPASQSQIVSAEKTRWSGFSGPRIRPIHLYGTYILLLLASISALSHSLNNSLNNAAASALLTSAVQSGQSGKLTSVVSDANQNGLTADGLNQGSPVELQISAKSNSWVKIVVDGKKTFEGTLDAGKAQSWKAQRELILTTGNAGGLVVTENNQQLGELGAPGQKKQLKFQAKTQS